MLRGDKEVIVEGTGGRPTRRSARGDAAQGDRRRDEAGVAERVAWGGLAAQRRSYKVGMRVRGTP